MSLLLAGQDPPAPYWGRPADEASDTMNDGSYTPQIGRGKLICTRRGYWRIPFPTRAPEARAAGQRGRD